MSNSGQLVTVESKKSAERWKGELGNLFLLCFDNCGCGVYPELEIECYTVRVERYCLFWEALLSLVSCSYWHTTWILINRLTWDKDKNYEWFSMGKSTLQKSWNPNVMIHTTQSFLASPQRWRMKTAQPELRTGNDFRKYCSRNQGRAKVCAVPMSPRLLSHKIRNTTSTNTNTNTKTNTKTNTWTNTGKNINTNANTHRRYWNKCLRESFRRSHVSQASESHVPEADTYVQFCTVMIHYQGRWLSQYTCLSLQCFAKDSEIPFLHQPSSEWIKSISPFKHFQPNFYYQSTVWHIPHYTKWQSIIYTFLTSRLCELS